MKDLAKYNKGRR